MASTAPLQAAEAQRFQKGKVQAVIRAALKEHVEEQQYDPVKGAQQAKQLADDLRERVKALGLERYKLVVQVTLGQKMGQAQRIVSRCLWDVQTDGSASETFENDSLYCTCMVYALHLD